MTEGEELEKEKVEASNTTGTLPVVMDCGQGTKGTLGAAKPPTARDRATRTKKGLVIILRHAQTSEFKNEGCTTIETTNGIGK
jgi:hypothetical protein